MGARDELAAASAAIAAEAAPHTGHRFHTRHGFGTGPGRCRQRRGSGACPHYLRCKEGLRRDRPDSFHEHQPLREAARSPRRVHAPLYRAQQGIQGLYGRTSPAPRRSARGERLPPVAEGNRLPDRYRAFQGFQGLGPRRQHVRRRAERFRHEPVRLAARLRARYGAQAVGGGLRDRSAASPGRRGREASVRTDRLRPRGTVQHRFGSGDGLRARGADRHRPRHPGDLHRVLSRHLRRGDRPRHKEAQVRSRRAGHPAQPAGSA